MGLFGLNASDVLKMLDRPEVKKYFENLWLKIREDVKNFLREEIKKAIADYFANKK